MGTKTLRKVLTGAIVCALAIRCGILFALPTNDVAQYVLTPCRMDSLALGGLVAILSRAKALPTARCLRWAGIAGASFCICMFTLISTSAYHPLLRSIGYSLIDVTLACGLAYVIKCPESTLTKVLRLHPLTYTGQIAYGLYLLHGPASWAARAALSRVIKITAFSSLDVAISFAASFVAAALSWNLFENRWLSLKTRLTESQRISTELPKAHSTAKGHFVISRDPKLELFTQPLWLRELHCPGIPSSAVNAFSKEQLDFEILKRMAQHSHAKKNFIHVTDLETQPVASTR